MNKSRNLLFLLAGLIVVGCGGAAGPSPAPGGSGSVSVSVQWPKPVSRVIPINTQFVWFQLKAAAPTTPDAYNSSAPNSAVVTQTSATGTIVVAPGAYSLVAEAFPVAPTDPRASTTAATAWQVMPVTVQPGANAFAITLGSTVNEFDLSYADSTGAAQVLKVSAGSTGKLAVPFNGELDGMTVAPTFNGTPLLVSTTPETFTATASSASPDLYVSNAASGASSTTISLGRYLPSYYGKTETLSLAYNDGTASSAAHAIATITFQNGTISAPTASAGPTLPAPPAGATYTAAVVNTGSGASALYSAVASDGQALLPNSSGTPGLSAATGILTCGLMPLDPYPYVFSDGSGSLSAYLNLATFVSDPIGPSGTSAKVVDLDSGTALYDLDFQLMLGSLSESVVGGVVTAIMVSTSADVSTADTGARLSNHAGTDPFVYSPAASAVFDGSPLKAIAFEAGSALPKQVVAVKGLYYSGSSASWKRFFLALDTTGHLDLCAEVLPRTGTTPVARVLTALNTSFLGGVPVNMSFDPSGNLWFLVSVNGGKSWQLMQATFG